MRNLQPRLVHDLVAVEQEIEVDRARAACGAFARAPELLLDRKQTVEELARGQIGLDSRRSVQEAGLILDPDWIGLANRGDRQQPDPVLLLQQAEGAGDQLLPVAEVGPEPDVGLHRSTVAAEYSTGRPSPVFRTRT